MNIRIRTLLSCLAAALVLGACGSIPAAQPPASMTGTTTAPAREAPATPATSVGADAATSWSWASCRSRRFFLPRSARCAWKRAHASWAPDAPIQGYDIPMGRTMVPAEALSLATIIRRGTMACAELDGCRSADGRIWGCYIHGVFANQAFRRGWLRTLGWRNGGYAPLCDPYERLADHVAASLDARQLNMLLAPY